MKKEEGLTILSSSYYEHWHYAALAHWDLCERFIPSGDQEDTGTGRKRAVGKGKCQVNPYSEISLLTSQIS